MQKKRRDRRDDPGQDLDILILGPVPPPFGGIAVHVQRLVPRLQRAGLRVAVLNHFRSTDLQFVVGALNRNPFKYYRRPQRFQVGVIHYHHSRWPHLVATALGKRAGTTRYIITLHGSAIRKQLPHLTSRLPLVSRITRWALGQFDILIAVDPEVASVLRMHLKEKRVEVFPAFLDANEEEIENYEPAIEEFLASGRVMLVAAYGIQFLQRGDELYGVDTAVEAFIDLAADHDDLLLAIFIARYPSGRKARRHFARLEGELEAAGLRERVLFAFGLPLIPAFRANTIYVRPTRAEGDAVSVREAQRAGVPVIASDVVGRPEGVYVVPVGNALLLSAAIASLLTSHVPSVSTSGRRRPSCAKDDFVPQLLRLYLSELAKLDHVPSQSAS